MEGHALRFLFQSNDPSASVQFSSVQLLSHVRLFVTPRTAASQASLSIINSWSLLKLMSIELDAIQLSHPLLSPSPPAFNLFQHQGLFQSQFFASGGQSFSFSISPSNEYSGLISFRMDWLDLVLVQGTLKSLLQHHCSKASIIQHSGWQPTPVFLPGKSHGWRSLTGYSPWCCKELDTTG